VTDYTVAVIGLVGAGIGAIAGLGGQIVQAWSSGGRERRAAQRTIKLEKRARLQPIYRRLIDAADVARAVAQQKGLAEAGETPEERERRHQEQIDKALKSLRYRRPVWPAQPGAQQKMLHLDIQVDDLEAAGARAVEAGAVLAGYQPHDNVRVYLDPAGHPFCLILQ